MKFGLDALRKDGPRRILGTLVFSFIAALFMVDYGDTNIRTYKIGEIVSHEIRSPVSFSYVDKEKTDALRDKEENKINPVFSFNAYRKAQLVERLRKAFSNARLQLGAEATVVEIRKMFVDDLGFSLSSNDLKKLDSLAWSSEVEEQIIRLIDNAMQQFIINDRNSLPKGSASYQVIRLYKNTKSEKTYDDWNLIKTPEEIRKMVAAEGAQIEGDGVIRRAAVAVAKAALRSNFSYNDMETEERRQEARSLVLDERIVVKKGTVILREGDPVTKRDVVKIQMILDHQEQSFGFWGAWFTMIAICAMVSISLFSFGAGFIRKFSIRPRDIEALSFLSLLVLGLSRLIADAAEPLSHAIGMGMSINALWFVTPIAGGAMLVRILINSETSLVWIIGTSILLGLIMEQQALFSVYCVVSGVVASAGLAHTKERVHLLRAGLQTGLVNAAAALLIRLAQIYIGSGEMGFSGFQQPLWEVGFAVLGGIVSAFLVLGLTPLFEQFGFVTDYKLLELANLNHPLLRQLMLKAPGTYHHSMTMALLSEAAAESIGANALATRIACYYHDIGKSFQPHYFIENQRGGVNPHDRLQPHQSARIIMTHVMDGAAVAERYNLPQPIMDAIWMHHGTSLIKYFYIRAVEQAGPDEVVDEKHFRYPGKRPNSRESGIIFLADRVEAACRSLKNPTAEDYQKMIQKLLNDAIAEGQLEECPLTIKEIYTITNVFKETLLSIHHHRIEYPKMPSEKSDEASPSKVITLEIPNPLSQEAKE